MINIYIAGHNGMVGSAIVRQFKGKSVNLITKNRKDLNLLDQINVNKFFKDNLIDHVYLCAAKVGGIYANIKYPADFIYQNLVIQNNIIHSAYASGVKKLLFLGSSCIYPKNYQRKIKEKDLLSAPIDSTNEYYAIAKIAGLKMCEAYRKQYGFDARAIMPSNLYGINDNYSYPNNHIVPALVQKLYHAKENNYDSVEIWGTGIAKRELLYADDLARAALLIMNLPIKKYSKLTEKDGNFVNVAPKKDISIKNIANEIKKAVGYQGKLIFNMDSSMDGVKRKKLCTLKIESIGWKQLTDLEAGLKNTVNDYIRKITDKA